MRNAEALFERMARAMALWRQGRTARARRTREAVWARKQAEKAASAAYESATSTERLKLATDVMIWAMIFKDSQEAKWAFRTHGRYALAHGLALGPRGHLHKVGTAHWYGRVKDEPCETPQKLARMFKTSELHEALDVAMNRRFWRRMAEIEVTTLLGFNGRRAR